MIDFLFEYGLFFAKAVTVVVAIVIVLVAAFAVGGRARKSHDTHLEIKKLNDDIDNRRDSLQSSVVDEACRKRLAKEKKAQLKAEKKANKKASKKKAKPDQDSDESSARRRRLYVLDFHGDLKASAVDHLREEVTSVLTLAEEQDEVVVRVESGGGMVHGYGLAASQLQRVKDKQIPLTICVDKVAASGGYMMACVADKLLAAPFAILGSIGVVAQIPNFHRVLKKHDVDFELLTAGEYKRTLTLFGENTDRGREKFQEDLEDIHQLFKEFVREHRPQLNMETVATGEIWFGQRALENQLVDELSTSDQYLADACEEADVFHLQYVEHKTLPQKLGLSLEGAADGILSRWLGRLQNSRFLF